MLILFSLICWYKRILYYKKIHDNEFYRHTKHISNASIASSVDRLIPTKEKQSERELKHIENK